MKNYKICVRENYPPLKIEQEYEVITEHYDHVVVRCKGRPICIPNNFICTPQQKHYREHIVSYEDIIEAEREELDF